MFSVAIYFKVVLLSLYLSAFLYSEVNSLWTEYLEECRQAGDEPLMYSQFCYYIQQDEQKRRATMHINRKPGEQVEVDWAGTRPTSQIRIPARSLMRTFLSVS